MKKRLFAIIIMSTMIFSMIPATVYAAQGETVMPMWDNASQITANVAFSNSKGTATVSILGKTGVSNISVVVKLFYKNTSGSWTEIDTDWEYNVDQRMLSISESFNAVAGREYKIEVSGTVTMNGYAESISKTATATCPTT